MTPIQKLHELTEVKAVQVYDEKMAEANKLYKQADELYEEAIQIKKHVKQLTESLPKAVEEYNNLDPLTKTIFDGMLYKIIAEIEKMGVKA